MVMAEGLLGAARLAHSLRSGSPSGTAAFNVAARRSVTRRVEPTLFYVGGSNFAHLAAHARLRHYIGWRDMPAEGFE